MSQNPVVKIQRSSYNTQSKDQGKASVRNQPVEDRKADEL